MSAEPIRVLLADDHELVREGLRTVLAQEPEFAVVGDAASGEHGDLLDIIATSCGHTIFRETLEEAVAQDLFKGLVIIGALILNAVSIYLKKQKQ